MKTVGARERRWPVLDGLRGIAIVMMLLSNFIYDLTMFGCKLDPHTGFLAWFSRATAAAFLLVAGIALTLSYHRLPPGAPRFPKYLRRGLRLLALALVVTLATWVAVGKGLVLFGILHLLGVSIILAAPLLPYKYPNLLAGLAVIGIGLWLNRLLAPSPWLLPLGVRYSGFYSVDYTPIFPWFGLLLLGIFLGHLCCPAGSPPPAPPRLLATPGGRLLSYLGRNSLRIYFIHQPLFLGLLWGWRVLAKFLAQG